jgi:hypothetical protein
MQHPEPDDGAWPARVLRNRRLNQTPEKENTATRLRFMHQRRVGRERLVFLSRAQRTSYQSDLFRKELPQMGCVAGVELEAAGRGIEQLRKLFW